MLPMRAGMPARRGSLLKTLWRQHMTSLSSRTAHSGKAKRGALGDLVHYMIHMRPSLHCADGVDKADLHHGQYNSLQLTLFHPGDEKILKNRMVHAN